MRTGRDGTEIEGSIRGPRGPTNHATYPQAMQPLSHHITTPDIAKPMVTNTGLVETNPCWFIQFSSFGLVYLVWYVCLQSPQPPAVGLILEPLCLKSPQGP